MTFEELGLSPDLLKTLKDKGYVSPTPIQSKIIPLILRGADVLACAPTGTGKTASFSLPLIEILSATQGKARMIRCLILVPTRELATQVCENFTEYTKNHKLKIAQFIGGASIVQQKQILNKGIDVAVATPGRFLDLYETGCILPTEIKNVVIDEADRMMDMGFLPDLRKILSAMPKMRQTVLLSATMPDPIKKLAQEFLMSPKEVMVAAPASTSTTIEQYFVNVPSSAKSESERLKIQVEIMLKLFKERSIGSAIIFCNKKHHVDKVYLQLKKKNFAVEVIHGDLTQSRRNRSLENMKTGVSQFLVASDVAARGIDINNLPCVVNMDIPMNLDDYVHRIGRTGRAGADGLAFTMVTAQARKAAKEVMKLIGKQIKFLDGDTFAEAEDSVAPEETSGKTHPKAHTSPSKEKGKGKFFKKKDHAGKKPQGHSPSSPPPQQQGSKPKQQDNAEGFDDDVPAFLK